MLLPTSECRAMQRAGHHVSPAGRGFRSCAAGAAFMTWWAGACTPMTDDGDDDEAMTWWVGACTVMSDDDIDDDDDGGPNMM